MKGGDVRYECFMMYICKHYYGHVMNIRRQLTFGIPDSII